MPAGLQAERLFGCETMHERAGWSDAAKMVEILGDLPSEEADDIRFNGYDRAFQILDTQHSLIERLAEPLAIIGRLEEGTFGPYFRFRERETIRRRRALTAAARA